MSRRIILWSPNLARTSDDAGTDILKYKLPTLMPGPYEEVSKLTANEPLTYVPSLRTLCLRQLAAYPNQLDWLEAFRIHYEKPTSPSKYDLVRSLVPGYSHENPDETSFLKDVDPRLWAVMIQTISPLPDAFRSYNIPISDTHVPLLQQIPSTPDFSLITIVQLYGKREVTDETIAELGALHSLVALDVGRTTLSSWGIKRLSNTLLTDKFIGSRRGPWSLRVLYLWNCMFVDGSVVEALAKFPLLSVVDLRGTKCKPSSAQGTWFGLPPQESELFYYPTPLSTSLRNLSGFTAEADPQHRSRLFSHPKPYILHITTLHHTPAKARTPPQVARYTSSDTITRKSLYFLDDVGHPTPRRAVLRNIIDCPDRNVRGSVKIMDISASKSRDGWRDSIPISPSGRNPLMFFRPPPPFDTSKTTTSSSSRSASAHRSLKRHQSEGTMKVLYGEEARSSKKAKESVQAVFDLAVKTVEVASPVAGPSNPVQNPCDNPFLRVGRIKPINNTNVLSGIDPDLKAAAERDRARPSSSKVALGKQPQRPFPNSDEFKEASRPRSTGFVSSRRSFMPTIDPALLASVEVDRHNEREKEKEASKVRTKKRKIDRKSMSRLDPGLDSSDDIATDFEDDSPPSPNRRKKSRICLAPTTAPPEKLKPLTALPMPQLPPELHRNGYTEADKAILLGTRVKRRKSEESSSGLKQLTLAAFTTPVSSTSVRPSVESSRNTSSLKKVITNKKRR